MTKIVLGFLGIIALMFGLAWAVEGNDFFMYKYFAPKQEAVRREVFEQSKAYNDGMSQQLDKERLEYIKLTPDQKAAERSIILHQFSGYDTSHLTFDQNQFLNQLERN